MAKHPRHPRKFICEISHFNQLVLDFYATLLLQLVSWIPLWLYVVGLILLPGIIYEELLTCRDAIYIVHVFVHVLFLPGFTWA